MVPDQGTQLPAPQRTVRWIAILGGTLLGILVSIAALSSFYQAWFPLDLGSAAARYLACGTGVFILWVGACIGSFLNVVVYRLPRRISLVTGGSACPVCGRAIRPWENVPILGWIWLGGRCRGCRTSIPLHYPLVELLTAACFLTVFAAFLLPVDSALGTECLAVRAVEAGIAVHWICVLLVSARLKQLNQPTPAGLIRYAALVQILVTLLGAAMFASRNCYPHLSAWLARQLSAPEQTSVRGVLTALLLIGSAVAGWSVSRWVFAAGSRGSSGDRSDRDWEEELSGWVSGWPLVAVVIPLSRALATAARRGWVSSRLEPWALGIAQLTSLIATPLVLRRAIGPHSGGWVLLAAGAGLTLLGAATRSLGRSR